MATHTCPGCFLTSLPGASSSGFNNLRVCVGGRGGAYHRKSTCEDQGDVEGMMLGPLCDLRCKRAANALKECSFSLLLFVLEFHHLYKDGYARGKEGSIYPYPSIWAKQSSLPLSLSPCLNLGAGEKGGKGGVFSMLKFLRKPAQIPPFPSRECTL